MNDDHLHQVLDDCLERYLRGESRQECVRRYPGYATEIESCLDAAERFIATNRDWPSSEDFERGRQRLLAEWEALQKQRRQHLGERRV